MVFISLTVSDTNGCSNTKIREIYVNPRPVSDFTTSSANCRHTVHFEDLSSSSVGYIWRWKWNFDDGSPIQTIDFPTDPNVYHSFPGFGPYNVSLEVFGTNGCSDTMMHVIELLPAPQAAFNITNNCAAAVTHFTDLSTSPGGISTILWFWDFGDPLSGLNNHSTLQNPDHIYSTAGTYTVSLIVMNANNCSDTIIQNITVKTLPAVNFTWSAPCVDQATQFTLDSTVMNLNTIIDFYWVFGDGNYSLIANPTHSFGQSGSFNVSLTVTDTNHCSNTRTYPVQISQPPVALFSYTDPTCVSNPVQFNDLSGTTSGYINRWIWNFGDNSPNDTIYFPNDPDRTKKYSAAGTYNVILTVTTSTGCMNSFNHNVIILPNPVANFHYSDSCQNILIHFSDASYPNSAGNIISWSWNFGDPGSGIENNSTLTNPSHLFSHGDSVYDVRLIIVNSDNCTDTISKPIYIFPEPPVNFRQCGLQGSACSF